MLDYFQFVFYFAVAMSVYLLGVYVGKRFERKKLVNDFHSILRRLLHSAAKQDYVTLHLFLQELLAEQSELAGFRSEDTENDPQEILARLRSSPQLPNPENNSQPE